MGSFLRQLIRYLPLILGILILAVVAPLVPWSKVGPYLSHISPKAIITLVLLSMVYYLGRILRYWLMLKMLNRPLAFKKVALACLVAQPVSILPAGEFYRASMLKRYGNVSFDHGTPSVFAQSLAESMGLVFLALIGAAILHRYVGILLGLTLIFILIWSFIRWHSVHTSHRLINRLPWVNISLSKLGMFLSKNKTLLTGSNLAVLLLASFISTAAGIAIMFVASHALGSPLSLLQATIAYSLPTALEAVSFLPAGLGINEQGTVGILTLFGLGLPVAVALTILIRLFTLGIGFVYGFAAMAWAHFGRYHQYDIKDSSK